MGIFLINHNNTGRNARTIKEVGGQADNSFDVSFADNIRADFRLSVSP